MNSKGSENSIRIERALRTGPKTSSDLEKILGVSQPTISRLLQESPDRFRKFGSRKGTVYGLPREVQKIGSEFSVFYVTESGGCELLGELTSVHERGYIFAKKNGAPQVFDGIPFYIDDHRPQGFLGRLFAQRHSDLGFPRKIEDWSEDQIFAALALREENMPGNLIIGAEAYKRYQQAEVITVPLNRRAEAYSEFGRNADAGLLPGSSVGGEQPKFSAFLEDNRNVLVKYSPDKSTEKGLRWADLLVAECLALEILAQELKIPTARTEIIEANNRVYLESTRFDRIGKSGRKGLLSFQALELEYIGSPSNWSASAQALARANKISQSDLRSILMMDTFGELIANSDRHYGNISFFFDLRNPKEKIILAPAYDMLPMFFAPRENEEKLFQRNWKKPIPNASNLSIWGDAVSAAILFWGKVIADNRISPNFKEEAKKLIAQLKT